MVMAETLVEIMHYNFEQSINESAQSTINKIKAEMMLAVNLKLSSPNYMSEENNSSSHKAAKGIQYNIQNFKRKVVQDNTKVKEEIIEDKALDKLFNKLNPKEPEIKKSALTGIEIESDITDIKD